MCNIAIEISKHENEWSKKEQNFVTDYSLAVDTRCLRSCEDTLLSSLLLSPSSLCPPESAGAKGLSENAPNCQHANGPSCALGNQRTMEANLEQTKILIATIPC